MEENNQSFPTEYRPVCQAEVFFEEVAEEEKAELKEHPNLSLLFSTMLNGAYASLLKFIENIIGVRLYASPDTRLPKISSRSKKLAASFSQKNIIKRIEKIVRIYHDEPALVHYQVEMPTSRSDISFYSDGGGSFSKLSGGADLNEEKALMKALGEGLERLCLCAYREKNLVLAHYHKILKKALNPFSFAGLSESQRQANERLKIDEKSIFRWVRGFSLFDKKKALIPAQLVHIGYKYYPNEPIIQEQISTGAAAADSFEGALYGGICEAVERDAFMITYLNKLSPPLIKLASVNGEEFQGLLAMFKRCNLELYVIDMTTDIALPSMMAVIIDRTGLGPVLHVGAKTSLNAAEAIKGAVFEVLRGRLGFRKMTPLSKNSMKRQEELNRDPSQIVTFSDRFLFWDSLDKISKIEFLFRGSAKEVSQLEQNKYQEVSPAEKLQIAVKLLQEKGVNVYGVDITMPQIKEEGIFVAKVVSPQLHPLYLTEKMRHLWSERVFRVPVSLGYRQKPLQESELNHLPHPFL